MGFFHIYVITWILSKISDDKDEQGGKSMNLKRLFLVTGCSTVGILLLILIYYYSPMYAVDQYFKCLNQKQYEKLYAMLYQDETVKHFSKDDILSYYEKIYHDSNYLITAGKQGKFIYKDITEKGNTIKAAFCNVKYTFDTKTETGTLVLIKENQKWKVKFPFKKESLKIYAPLGSQVYVNNILLEENNEHMYKEKLVLPGKYMVRVTFDNPLYNEYITTVNVPETTELFLPYEMLNVSIKTYKNSIVELAGCKKKNPNGTLQFNNLLEGTYMVKVYDEYGFIEPLEEKIEVRRESKIFDITSPKLSQKGKQKLDAFLKEFYMVYKQGIIEHTADDLYKYLDYKNRLHIIDEYSSWFIDNKDIQDATVTVTVEDTKINSSGELEVIILEDVTLTNKEVDDESNESQQDYRLALKWKKTIDMTDEGAWKIENKEILGSTIACKDLEGEWTEY